MKKSMTRWVPLTLALLVGCSGSPSTDTAVSPKTGDASVWPEMHSPLNDPGAYEAEIDAMLAKMSVEEKVGQLIQPELRNVTPEDVKRYHLGSILNGGGSFPGGDKNAPASAWLALADEFYRASMDTSDGRVAIPLVWATDAVHGHNNVKGATLFPHNIALGATRNPNLIRRIGEVTAREVSVTGLDWNFSPTLAVARDDRWGRTYEAYSEDPETLYEYGKAMVTGLQGEVNTEGFFDRGHVWATAKHFIADGGTEGGIDRGDAKISESELRDLHAAGYFGALDAGVQTVMASFSSWQGEKLHGHRYLLTDVLKGELGFDGLIVGDWNGHEFVDGCRQDSCPQAINAGLDIFMVPDQWRTLHANTVAQVKSGEISKARLNDAVRRVLRVKFRSGMFDKGLPSERYYAGASELLGAPAHRAVARQAVRESLVLLKNNNQLLPLSPGQDVLVAGDGADNIGKQAGGWTLTWQGTGNTSDDFPGATSIYDGIVNAVEAAGGRAELSVEGHYSTKPDVAVVVFGEDPYAEMQGDRANLDYEPEADWVLLKRLQSEGIPVVSVFLTGRPLWVNPEINASDAFVVAWLPGSEGGGVADVLFRNENGDIAYDFTGKLSFSWPARADQTPVNRNDDREPLFPYGYGLTYEDDGELGSLPEDSGLSRAAAQTRLFLFDNRPMEPWELVLSDVSERALVMSGSEASLPGIEATAVDREFQEDSRQLHWTGAGEAEVALRSQGRVDLSAYRESGVLLLDLKIDAAPNAPVTLGMRCGQDCVSAVDISGWLDAHADGQWHTLAIDADCLMSGGVNPSMVLSPLYLATGGELTLTLNDVRLVTEYEEEGLCP
ncbi:glycoside hydrolase family 3 N-terminal domain-containing protein [Marinimicrobium agarilyticum]|uniref:glycoside hydrolase family 3 N-terminal domain-containing protein n=1 Tax=Marinimicrobium agarilyticum TaxID=306546 RepID=UPI0004094C28|nr:glycoside hydrolase family 3 N-terminal domain-containing protein [Marinimicrobium agarilyticum]